MADRTRAALFGKVFRVLADDIKSGSWEARELASEIFNLTRRHDFEPDQMDADEACSKLLIRRTGIHAFYPQEGEQDLWPDDPRLELRDFAELCDFEPKLRRLETWANDISITIDRDEAMDQWKDLFHALNQLVGFCRPKPHPILSGSDAWSIAYPYLWDLSRS